MAQYAVEVERQAADGFQIAGAEVLERTENLEDDTVIFIVESPRDIRWTVDQPGVISIEPL